MAVSIPHRLEPFALLTLMSDGAIRSPAQLARELDTSCEAIESLVRILRDRAIDIDAIAGHGYRLSTAVELLDAGRIQAALRPEFRPKIHRLDVLFEVNSTNTHLLERAPPPPGRANVCVSELQHAGRGRHGRAWISPFGGALALSLGRCFADAARVDPAMSLAAGVAIVRALRRFGATGVRLKWPNDIWLNDRKIGGILIELRTEAGGQAHAVIGIGLNVSLSADNRQRIEAHGVRVAAVSDACPAEVSRNLLTAALSEQLLSMLEDFEQSGFAAFREEWLTLDALSGRQARVLAGDSAVEGTARGVDEGGALLLDVAGSVQRHVSGEVSLRLSEGDA